MRPPIVLDRGLFWRLVNAYHLTVDHREGWFFAEDHGAGVEFCTTEAAVEVAA